MQKMVVGILGFIFVLKAQGAVESLPASALPLISTGERQFVGGGKNVRQLTIASLDGEPDGVRLSVVGPRPLEDYSIQAHIPVTEKVKKGEGLFLRFQARCLESKEETGAGLVSPMVEMENRPYTKLISSRFSVGKEWSTFAACGISDRDYESGILVIRLRVGYAPQTLEFRKFELYKLPPSVDISTLPITRAPSYPGREDNAAWRAEAEKRIDKYRKQDLSVVVLNAKGKPVKGAVINVEQKKHAFAFGSATVFCDIGDPAVVEKYRKVMQESFDEVSLANALKWANWIKEPQKALDALKWLKEQGYSPRGHVIIWPSSDHVPPFVEAMKNQPDKLKATIFDHMKDIMERTAPYIYEWDVVNEPIFCHDILDVFGGNLFMVDLFKEARKIRPDVQLCLNEAFTFTPDEKFEKFYSMVKQLNEQGAPIDTLGVQCHYSGWTLTPPEQIVTSLDKLQTLGKKISVTEFDLDSLDDKLQADYVRDFYTAVFSHPAVQRIQMWDFWEGRHWKPTAALWKRNWEIRPAGQAYLDLVRKKWWTREKGISDKDGQWSCRAFKGQFKITVQSGTGEVSQDIDLGDHAGKVVIRLPSTK